VGALHAMSYARVSCRKRWAISWASC